MINNYDKMIKRDKKKGRKKKVVRKPDNRMDDFVREMELLKKDLSALTDKKTKEKSSKPQGQDKEQKIKSEVDADLMQAAEKVLSNLSGSPSYYVRRDHVDRLAGLERPPIAKKVSRQDASKIAKELGIDFSKVKFSPDSFRKGIESEIRGDSSLVDRDDDIFPGVADDRLGRSD